MEHSIFENTSGLEIYPIISLIFFLLLFLGISIWIFRLKKTYLKQMSELPLDRDTTGKVQKENIYEN